MRPNVARRPLICRSFPGSLTSGGSGFRVRIPPSSERRVIPDGNIVPSVACNQTAGQAETAPRRRVSAVWSACAVVVSSRAENGPGPTPTNDSRLEIPHMKITDVKPLVLGTSWRNLIFIKVETDEGVTGIGEITIQNRRKVFSGTSKEPNGVTSSAAIRSTSKTSGCGCTATTSGATASSPRRP